MVRAAIKKSLFDSTRQIAARWSWGEGSADRASEEGMEGKIETVARRLAPYELVVAEFMRPTHFLAVSPRVRKKPKAVTVMVAASLLGRLL